MKSINNNYQNNERDTKRSILSIILKYGGIGIGILILIALIQTSILNLDFDRGGLYFNVLSVSHILIQDIVYIILMILAVKSYKEDNGGFASFLKVFNVSFSTGIFMAFISMFFYILIFYLFESVHSPIGTIALTYLTSFLKNSLIGLVVAGVISFFMKKNRTIEIESN